MGLGTRGLSCRLLGVLAASLVLAGCWTQVGFGPEHRRYNPFEQGITTDNVDTLSPLWTRELQGGVSQPMLANGRVHISRDDNTIRSYDVDALDAATGDTLWTRNLLPSSQSSPTLSIGVTFSGNELWGSYAAPEGVALVRLDPESGATIAQEDGELVASPVVTGDDVLAYLRLGGTFADTTVVVRDRTTLATLWTATITGAPRSVMIGDGRIYLVSQTTLAAYPAAGCGAGTCTPLWQQQLTDGSGINGAAAGPDGQVVTTTAFRFVEDRHGQRFPSPSTLTVRDGATGAALWSGGVTSATGGLAIDDSRIYLSTRHELDDLGQPLGTDGLTAFALDGCGLPSCAGTWSTTLAAPPSAPLVGGGVVYTSVGNDLHALATDGSALATFPGLGAPVSLGEGQLYTTTFAAGTTTLRALAPVS